MKRHAPILALLLVAAPAGAATSRSPAPAPRTPSTSPAPTPPPPVPPSAVAFLGLRPTETVAFGATSLAQVAEAQRLRAIVENVVGLLSGAPVLRHDDLRKLVGATYLAELFECRGEVACQLRVAAPLRARGVAAAITADAYADPDAFRIRLRRLDLTRGRVVDEATFSIPRATAETLAPWREALQRLFQDTGSLRIASNVPDPACTLDGRPCEVGSAGVIASVPEGEHVVELSKEGYRRGVRVVVVKRGEELRVALPLEELPVQAQKAPDPTNRVPIFAEPGDTTRVAPFGFLRVAMGWDNTNGGDREDQLAPPRSSLVDEGHLLVLPRPAVLGVMIQAPRRESGWQLRGAFSTAWIKETTPEIDSAYAELVKQDYGFRMAFGLAPSIFSGLTAGTLTLPEAFGDLAGGFIGVTVSKSFGDLLFEVFGGRHKSQFSSVNTPGAASPGAFAAARVAFVDEEVEGRLYGEKYPLTIGVSGVFGAERVGLDDEATFLASYLGSVAVAREQAQVWAACLEIHIPFGKHVDLAGEGFVGENVHLLEGAAWQPPRVDPLTGRHIALRSAGGWAQLSFNIGDVELRLIGGLDRILRGLDGGLAPDGKPAVRENALLAANVVWYLMEQRLALGVQVQSVRTRYGDPALGHASLLGGVFTSQLKF